MKTYLLSRTMLNLESPDFPIVLLIMSRWNTDLRASPLPTGGSVMNCQHSLWDDTIFLKEKGICTILFASLSSFLVKLDPCNTCNFFVVKLYFYHCGSSSHTWRWRKSLCPVYYSEKNLSASHENYTLFLTLSTEINDKTNKPEPNKLQLVRHTPTLL